MNILWGVSGWKAKIMWILICVLPGSLLVSALILGVIWLNKVYHKKMGWSFMAQMRRLACRISPKI